MIPATRRCWAWVAAGGASQRGAVLEAVGVVQGHLAPSWVRRLFPRRGQDLWGDRLHTRDHPRHTTVMDLLRRRALYHHSTLVQGQVHMVTAWVLSRQAAMEGVLGLTSNSRTLRSRG